MKNKTLAEVDAEYFALIMSCHEAVINEMDNPEFVRVCPPPEDKTPGSLIYAWGIEMFRLGFEKGFDLLDKLNNMEGNPDESVHH